MFTDDIDATGTETSDSDSRVGSEIARMTWELLNQLDGFDSRGDVKVMMATNRIET